VVIDFIDMEQNSHVRKVEKAMKEALKNDRARIQVGRISSFGLMEMSRQRLRTGVLEASTKPCPHCEGTGLMRTAASAGLSALRMLEDEAARGRGERICLRAGKEAAIYVLNKKRSELADIEQRYGVMIEVLVDESFEGARMSVDSSGPRPVAVPRPQAQAIEAEEEFDEEPIEDEDEEAEEGEAEEREQAGEGERQGRRRRRRRRGGRGRDEAGAEGAVEGDNGEGTRADGESAEVAEVAEATEGEAAAEGEGGSRRRRGGRNRGARREDGAGDTRGETAAGDLPGNAALTEAAGVAEPALAPVLADDAVEPAQADETPARMAMPFESRAFAAPAPVAPALAPAPAAAAPIAPARPVVPEFELPVGELNSLAGSAGLEWVHSNAEAVRAAQEAIANTPTPAHVPRERPPVVVVDEGPLVLVETRKDLSQIKLPFDTQA
jgi:ribonuclease E